MINNPEVVVIILTTFGILGLLLTFRNNWVYHACIKAIGEGFYDELPSYEAMMWKFWIWNVERFRG